MKNFLWVGLLTVVMEVATCIGRFGFNLQSTRDLSFLSKLTFGIRIHHGYIGLLFVIVALSAGFSATARQWLLRLGLAMVLSDLIHHFIVLWIATGSPQFDITYPKQK
ncbi:MAG TPA: hypothetical protein PKI19_07305 [Elusimicrobiales bacterium]|nr:hypothetical protein [Elusimicrobiales bacterium]